jgi:hypothetical protein
MYHGAFGLVKFFCLISEEELIAKENFSIQTRKVSGGRMKLHMGVLAI